MSDDGYPPGIRQRPWSPPPGSATIVLVRHGESMPEHPDHPHPTRDGHVDPDLAPHGHVQARLVADRLVGEHRAGPPFDAVYVTSLRRTHQTAEPFGRDTGLEVVEVPELREVHLGEWEGRFRERVVAGDPVFLEALEAQRWDVIPGAESTEAFEQRLRDGIDLIVADHPGGHVVAVVHGGVIGQLIATATGATGLAFTTADNASISELVVMPNGVWRIRRYNDTSHLD